MPQNNTKQYAQKSTKYGPLKENCTAGWMVETNDKMGTDNANATAVCVINRWG